KMGCCESVPTDIPEASPGSSRHKSSVPLVHARSSQGASIEAVMGEEVQYEDIQTLVTIPFFDDLDTRRMKDLKVFKRQTFEAGEVIAQEGAVANAFYVIINGRVK